MDKIKDLVVDVSMEALNDTPDFSGQDGKFVKVDEAQDRLVYEDIISTTINPDYQAIVATTDLIYTLNFTPNTKGNVLVFSNGKLLHTDDFSLVANTITFNAGVLEIGDELLIYNINIAIRISEVSDLNPGSHFSLYHDDTNGHIENDLGILYLDTAPDGGVMADGEIRTHGNMYATHVGNKTADDLKAETIKYSLVFG